MSFSRVRANGGLGWKEPVQKQNVEFLASGKTHAVGVNEIQILQLTGKEESGKTVVLG